MLQGSEPRKGVAMRRERPPVPEEQKLGSRVRQVLMGLSRDERGGQSLPFHPEPPLPCFLMGIAQVMEFKIKLYESV